MQSLIRRRAAWVGVLLLGLGCGLAGGCQAPGFVLDTLIPPSDIPAEYEPEDRRTLVLVDDPGRVLPPQASAGTIAAAAERALEQEKVITQFADARELERARLNESDFDRWSIARIGRHLEVEQVIHVTLASFDPIDPEQTRGPSAGARVKLIDVETGERLFPERRPNGHGVNTQMAFQHRPPANAGALAALNQSLAAQLGEQVAKVFYDHPPRPVGSEFD